MTTLVRPRRTVIVGASLAALLSLGASGCSQANTETPPMPASVSASDRNEVRAVGEEALRLVKEVAGATWDTDDDSNGFSANDCYLDSETKGVLFQWSSTGPEISDGANYIKHVAAALVDAGYSTTTRTTTLERYGTSRQAVGRGDVVSAVSVASNEKAVIASVETICVPGSPEDSPDR
ncbi:hypothetical protein ITJ68_16065 [Curtobacterium sp. VKM Ac-1395]|nr:hypothetical protein [Curtobacterium sp. VKM Ac-1395]